MSYAEAKKDIAVCADAKCAMEARGGRLLFLSMAAAMGGFLFGYDSYPDVAHPAKNFPYGNIAGPVQRRINHVKRFVNPADPEVQDRPVVILCCFAADIGNDSFGKILMEIRERI